MYSGQLASPVEVRKVQGPYVYPIHRTYIHNYFAMLVVSNDDIAPTLGTKVMRGIFARELIHGEIFEFTSSEGQPRLRRIAIWDARAT